MRKDEFSFTYKLFKNRYKLDVKLINASKYFLKNLKMFRPEKKRKIIGNLFIKIFEKESKKLKMLNF